ncbi:MAG: 1-deoxy-D-xylulose-5-phosphate reductoisomerase [Gammaproteobacteria bacterium]|nr:MAG: 1-deoxy-D-xylulose-5-phosphate reductoisomerase [Gammaproteobacteria bacterium]
MRALSILGSTGSVGASTLDVVRRNPDAFRVEALTARRRVTELAEQCAEFRPTLAVVADPNSAGQLREELRKRGLSTAAASGVDGLARAATLPEADTVVAAIVGSAGLLPTLAAAEAAKRVLLANKESAVMAGGLLMEAVGRNGATLIPIDSEHNAIFQCLPSAGVVADAGVDRILLTASGGPFLDMAPEELADVTPEQACAHPNWDMGRKISVDSATMMNKGLEIIEACRLFGVEPERVQVVVHPQSIIHSLVQYRDGSVLAQLGNPDMRTPIAHALAWPERIESGAEPLDLFDVGRLDFREPDLERFPCLGLAMEAAIAGGGQPIWLNAANEIAVQAFLDGRIPFSAIAALIASVLAECRASSPGTLEEIIGADREARQKAREKLADFAI